MCALNDEVAQYVGSKARQVQERERPWLQKDGIDYKCSFILGGQIKGEAPALFLIYTQGNFIQASKETPFLQIGETKYGKPILDRILDFDTPLESGRLVKWVVGPASVATRKPQ